MPRRAKKKKADAKPKGQTYFKAKNGRFYKKIQVEGKTRVRFVTNAEATGAITVSKSSKKKTSRKPRQSQNQQEAPAESPDEKVSEE